jgi:Zn-dependent M28 family amino/carboxypeptidase
MHSPRTPLVALAVLFASITPTFAQSNDAVMQEALKADTPLAENLRVLTDEIGGRVPGTPAMSKAEQWAVNGFKQAGADSVHTEEFSIAQSWAEGDTQVNVVAPQQFQVRAVSLGWIAPLPKTTARVVDVGMGTAEDFAKAGDINGAIVLVNSKVLATWEDLFEEYFSAPGVIERAVKGKALLIAYTATRDYDILYRHINTMNGKMDVIPQVLLAREDALRIHRLIAHGEKVQMSVSLPNKVGPTITARNVIAEIKGTDLSNEVVIYGAHLDSWNLGTGALDNGCNAATVIDTVRAIKAAGIHPRRTMRFILFSGEEQGMLGSLAYVRAHRSEMDNITAVYVLDAGDGAFTGFSTQGRKDTDAALAPLLRPFAGYKATEITNDAELGTDNYDFMIEGVPTILPDQETANYLINYHATSDTYDKVDFAQLKKNEAMSAELMVELANMPQRLGPRLTRKQIEATFPDTHLDDAMKGFRIWDEWANGQRGRQP